MLTWTSCIIGYVQELVNTDLKNIAKQSRRFFYLTELLSKYLPTRTLRSGNMELLKERKSNRTWGDRSFTIAAPRLWNELPFNIRTAKSIAVFKKKNK